MINKINIYITISISAFILSMCLNSTVWSAPDPISEDINVEIPDSAVFQLKDAANRVNNPIGRNSIGTMMLGLFFVLAIIFGMAWLSKRLKWKGLGVGQAIKPISVINVGGKEKLLIVEVDGQRLLLGVTPNSITLLKMLESTDSISIKVDSVSGHNDFSNTIKKMIASGIEKND